MKNRLKQVRNLSGAKNQQEFADLLGVSKNNISSYEAGRRVPSDALISLLCSKFKINREWLLEGKGEMISEQAVNVANYVSSLLEEPDSKRSQLIIGIMQAYDNMTPENQKTMNAFIQLFLDNIKK